MRPRKLGKVTFRIAIFSAAVVAILLIAILLQFKWTLGQGSNGFGMIVYDAEGNEFPGYLPPLTDCLRSNLDNDDESDIRRSCNEVGGLIVGSSCWGYFCSKRQLAR